MREVTYSIDSLQERITQDIKGQVTARLDATVEEPRFGFDETEIFLLDGELFSADGQRDDRQFGFGGVGREDVALRVVVVGCAGDGVVDCLAGSVVDQGQGGAGIGHGGIAAAVDGFAVHRGGGRVELPEALRAVDGCVVDLLAACGDGGLVDVPKGEEGFPLVGLVGVPP